MKPQEFRLPTAWRVKGSVVRVYDILTTPEHFTRWWPSVYLDVREIRPGDANGVGRVVRVVTKGKLPYRLSWEAEVLEADKPHRCLIAARGDLTGRGEWRFAQDGEWTEVRYDWTVLVTKPWMVLLAPVLKPIFAANHVWAMQRGYEGLQRELASSA
jgi:hypothetical protein